MPSTAQTSEASPSAGMTTSPKLCATHSRAPAAPLRSSRTSRRFLVSGNPAAPAAAQCYRGRARRRGGDGHCTSGREQLNTDVCVTNPLSASFVEAAAQCDGTAAQKRDEAKTAAYAARGDSGYKFIPVSVETHGRQGQPAMALLDTIGSAASKAVLGAFSKRRFIDGVLQQLSVVLKDNSRMEAPVAGFVLRHPGREWRRPCAAPSSEIGEGL